MNTKPYHAYIASAVRPDWDSSNVLGYEKVLEMAREVNDTKALESLESIQSFDPRTAGHLQVKNAMLSQYLIGDFHTEGLEKAWLDYARKGRSPEYPSPYIKPTLTGLDFSRQTIGQEVTNSGYDLFTDFPASTIPVHFLQGRYDYVCPGELAEAYYNALQAPVKSFTWFENSAHDVYYDEPGKFTQEVVRVAQETLAAIAD